MGQHRPKGNVPDNLSDNRAAGELMPSRDTSNVVPLKGERQRRVLLKGRRLLVMSDGESRLIVRSRPSWIYAGLMAVCVVLSMFMVLLGGMMFFLGLFPPKPDPAQDGFRLLLGTFCTLLTVVMHICVIFLFLKMAFPKVTVIDLATESIRLHHIPSFARDLRLADVASVDLVMLTEKGTCHLGLTEGSTGIVRSIHWLGGQFDTSLANRNAMLPASRLIARFCDKPLAGC